MKLLELQIENFGKLSDFTLKFTDGLNAVSEDNGYGKTTITFFIKAMLYGFCDTKSTKLEKNDRKRYTPWQGGRFGGSLSFEAAGVTYRIERTFGKRAGEDEFKLYELSGGRVSSAYTSNIGEELFGIDADGFERTIFLSEANLSGKNENKTVSAKLSDLVGYDGDLTNMDDAIALLEKRRQVYYKQGGSGEIGNIKKQIASLDYEINDLTRERSALSAEEEKIKSLSEKLNEANAKKEAELLEAKRLGELKLKQALLLEYRNMKKALERDEASLASLKEFFKNGVPTTEEIAKAREDAARAENLLSKESVGDTSELDNLSSFFSVNIPTESFDKAKSDLAKIEEQKTVCERIKYKIDSVGKSRAKSAPTLEEINSHIEKLNKDKPAENQNKGGHTFFFLSLISVVLGIILGALVNPFLFAVALLAIPAFLVSVKTHKNGEKSYTGDTQPDRTKLFLQEWAELFDGEASVIEKLYTLRSISKDYYEKKAEVARLEEELRTAESILSDYVEEVYSFVITFMETKRESAVSDLSLILRKRELYLALLSAKSLEIKHREQDFLLAKQLESTVSSFLSRFPTVTQKPFDEISEKLIEYSALLRSTETSATRVAEFAKEHEIGAELSEYDPTAETQSKERLSKIDEVIAELLKEKAVSERQFNAIYERILKIDDLVAEREVLRARAEKYQNELDVVRATRELLISAKDSLTSKYLSKTKTAFDKYIDLISVFEKEDFVMDTSFSLMKNEHGSLKSAEAYSRGERDLISLAARFALVDSLYENEKPFIVLDDPFAYFDDARLAAACSAVLKIAEEKQIIYLTCTEARKIQ